MQIQQNLLALASDHWRRFYGWVEHVPMAHPFTNLDLAVYLCMARHLGRPPATRLFLARAIHFRRLTPHIEHRDPCARDAGCPQLEA